ncbi:MAG: CotH kinase family protein [Flavobacteriia bacterium]|nr:CotH kinase family protein [Flavobacteriia bacterium]
MIKSVLSIASFVLISNLFAQTFNGGGVAILDNQQVLSPTSVSGLPTSINTTTFGLERVCVNLTHTYLADLVIYIVAPDGNYSGLMLNAGGGGDDLQNTCFQWDAPTFINSGSAPFTGSFKPMEEIGILNNGQNPNGTWQLFIADQANGDEGMLIDWSITFSNNPADFFQLTSSDLPIVVINTNGQGIPDEPKIQADMGIIYNGPGMINYMTDPFNNYNNKIGIEQRGSSSAGFPQKSYGFETRDVNGTQHDTILLGMPKEHDWILYAPYNDKTCMRNILSYDTGGYIIKVDRDDGPGSYWDSPYLSSANTTIRIVHVEPKGDAIMPQQRTYIQEYVDSFETALDGVNFADPVNGYRKYIDVPSFVDHLLLNEASKNIDAYRLSAFLYKDKNSNGGKLVAGPAWDYNLAWWNADYCQAWTDSGWVYQFNDYCGGGYDVPFWWDKLMTDPAFQSDVKCRWTELRQSTLSFTSLNYVIDSLAAKIDQAQVRHFTTWPLLGTYTWPNPSPIPADFPGEIQAMKDWIQLRFAWMDANIDGICYLGLENAVLSEEHFTASPNPFNDEVALSFYLPSAHTLALSVTDMLGNIVYRVEPEMYQSGQHDLQINLPSDLRSGMYLLQINSGNERITKKLLKTARD